MKTAALWSSLGPGISGVPIVGLAVVSNRDQNSCNRLVGMARQQARTGSKGSPAPAADAPSSLTEQAPDPAPAPRGFPLDVTGRGDAAVGSSTRSKASSCAGTSGHAPWVGLPAAAGNLRRCITTGLLAIPRFPAMTR